MPYVMVPVPEEHVEDVMQFILREVAKANLEQWDAESVATLYHDVDEVARSLLAYVARATASSKDLSEAEAADVMQIRPREIAGVIRELSEHASRLNRPSPVGARLVEQMLPNGRSTEKRVLWMQKELAPLVADAEKAELAGLPEPLGDRSS